MAFDLVKLELIRHGLEMISDNMMVSVVRTARSTLVKNNLDFPAPSAMRKAIWWRRGWHCRRILAP